jgi:hypothetical protein
MGSFVRFEMSKINFNQLEEYVPNNYTFLCKFPILPTTILPILSLNLKDKKIPMNKMNNLNKPV